MFHNQAECTAIIRDSKLEKYTSFARKIGLKSLAQTYFLSLSLVHTHILNLHFPLSLSVMIPLSKMTLSFSFFLSLKL